MTWDRELEGRPTAAPADIRPLFGRLATGDLSALDPIYREVADDLYGLALWITGSREDAADVVQEVFVKLALRKDRLGAVRAPLPYLLAMARTVAIDRHRARRPEELFTEDLLLAAPAGRPNAGLDAERASAHLRRLPGEQREAVYLRFFSGLSYAAIGRLTGVPLFTAASRCRLGLAKLRRLMGVEP